MRIGHGYDAHRLTDHRKLVLGGVIVPFHKGLSGHSDADVLTHAIMDALLGAAALGDIGKHFPPTDDEYLDISSIVLLTRVKELLEGYNIVNIDATIVAEKPKLAVYIESMRQNIATALGIGCELVSIKATTTEGMGFEGRGEGISATAVCILD